MTAFVYHSGAPNTGAPVFFVPAWQEMSKEYEKNRDQHNG
jgi:hypothetical protein